MTQNCSCHGAGDTHAQTVAGLLERPRYSPGLILEDGDLTAAVDYGRSLSRLLFRNLFGCGVVCGLVVSLKEECGLEITVAPGLALDGCGDPIEVPRPVTISIDPNEREKLQSRGSEEKPVEYWVVLCGKEKMCAPRALVCDADEFDGATQPTRIRALAEVSIIPAPVCACGCQPPPKQGASAQAAAPLPGVAEVEEECHHLHESRAECVADCGCGSACASGCCVLLARVAYEGKPQSWGVQNRGQRRFIRPAMLPDPAERPEGWVSPGARAAEVYWGEAGDRSDRVNAMKALYPETRIGSVVTQEMSMKMANWAHRQRIERGNDAEVSAEVSAEAEKAREAERAKEAAGKEKAKAAADKAAGAAKK